MLTVPGTISIDEDVTTAITGISIADVDAGSGNITVTLSVPGGALAATTGSGVTVGGTATALTLTGTLADINAFIAASNVTYTTALNNDSDVNLTVLVNDKGNTGTGGAKTDSEVVTLDVQAVNDAPVAAVPASITVTEDSPSNITGISFSDVDAGTGSVTVTLSVTAGTLAATASGGVAVAGSGTGTVMLTGTVAAINSFIGGNNVTYTTAADDTAAQTLTVSIDDNGNTGSGGPKTDSETVTLNVTAVNDAPVLTVPGTIGIDEDVTTAITGISIADVDATALAVITVTLSVLSGTLAATTGGGVTVGGTATALTLAGTLADLNTFLGGGNVTYTTALNNDGDVNLTVLVNDGGSSGTGGAKTDSEVVTLDVQAVNDPPVATVPANISVTEDVASDITGISFSNVDAGTSDVTVTLSVSAGTLTALSGPFVAVTGSGTASITLTGTVSAINSFMASGTVDFTTPLNSNASETLTVSIDDNGNTGSGGPKTDTETVTLNVTPVNDAPTSIDLVPSAVDEESAGAFVGNLKVNDPDGLDTHTLTVNDARFEIDTGKLQLKLGETLDFESEPTVTIQVTATDSGGLTRIETLVITVNDTIGDSKTGTNNADKLSGADQDDTLSGGKDSDTLDGGSGSDSLDGGEDNDNLDGGAGNDTLDGGSGKDFISAGTGNDRIIWDPSDGAIDGGAGTDTIFLNGSDIDLSGIMSSIEIIDMTGGGANQTKLSAIDVLLVSDTDTITVTGDAGDTIDLGGEAWSFAGTDANGNNIFTRDPGFGTATLVVDPDVTLV